MTANYGVSMEKKSDNRVCMDNKAGFENSGPKPAITNPPPSQPDLSPSGQVRGQIGLAEPGHGVQSRAHT